jgi:hypothetical protein
MQRLRRGIFPGHWFDRFSSFPRFQQPSYKQKMTILLSSTIFFAFYVAFADVFTFERFALDETEPSFMSQRVAPVSTIKLCLSEQEARRLGVITGIQAIVVLGGGPADQSTGEMPSWSKERCHRTAALHLCLQQHQFELPVLCASGESAHAPHYRDSEGYTVYESSSMADCLIQLGVAARNIFREWQSGDTVGNAVFVRSVLTDPLSISKLIVITSDFHIERSCAIFRWIYQLPSFSSCLRGMHAQIACLGVPHVNPPNQADIALARREKEKSALQRLEGVMRRIRDFQEVMLWLLREHGMYSAAVKPERLQGRLQAMYREIHAPYANYSGPPPPKDLVFSDLPVLTHHPSNIFNLISSAAIFLLK